jgi:hypothetical protein
MLQNISFNCAKWNFFVYICTIKKITQNTHYFEPLTSVI